MQNPIRSCRKFIAATLILLTAGAAYAEETRQLRVTTQPLSQTVYKGVVGNILEEVPIDPGERVDLQRGSAVISSTLSGRSLAIALGITNPVFLAVGLAWGLYAASQINVPRADVTTPKLASSAPTKHAPVAEVAASANLEPVSLALAEDPMLCRGHDAAAEVTAADATAAEANPMEATAADATAAEATAAEAVAAEASVPAVAVIAAEAVAGEAAATDGLIASIR